MKLSEPLWLLLALPLFLVMWRVRAAAIVLPAVVGARVAPSARRLLAPFARLLRPIAVGLLVFALAGPREGISTYTTVSEGTDIEIVLDVSGSMRHLDPGAVRTRLEIARNALEDFVARRKDDRIGLLTFALYPRVVSPLTRDHRALLESFANVRAVPLNSEEDNTAIGIALAAAAMRLAQDDVAGGGRKAAKVIVLLTDGEQRVQDVALSDAADFVAARGVRLYAIASGRARGLWTRKLDEIATRTGGRSFFARDRAALESVCREIDGLEKAPAVTTEATLFGDAHAPFLVAAAAILLLEAMLRAFVFREAP